MDAAINSENKPSRMYPLVMHQGAIIRPDLNKETAVCVVANACGKTAYATSGMLEREYAHADLYRCRRRMFSTSRAITDDRDRTGSIVVRSGDVGPTIIYLIAHFGPGKSLENNEIAMKQLRSSTDRHYVARLTSDKLDDRLKKLDECLGFLFAQLKDMNINEILFPVEEEGGSWCNSYVVPIQNFAMPCMPLKIPVVLINHNSCIQPKSDICNVQPRVVRQEMKPRTALV